MSLVRWVLGRIILLLNFIFSPRSIKRCINEQQVIDKKTNNLALYEFKACPFCVKVRRSIKRNALSIEIRDAKRNVEHRQTLLEQGGKIKVPCLRITDGEKVTWLYESSDIVSYLNDEIIGAKAA